MCKKSSGIWLSFLLASWSARVLCLLLCTVLLLIPSPIFGQSSPPTSRLGPSDYLSFQQDLLTVKLQLAASRQALEQALAEKQIIEQNLAETQQKYDALVVSGMQHSDDSTRLYELALEDVRRLRQQLKESQTMVVELQQSLESAQAEYDRKLGQMQKQIRRQTIEKWAIGILAGAAAGYIGYRIGKL